MNTLYILGNGFDIDLGFDTTYSSYVKSVHFQGDPFNDDVKGLKHDSLHDEVKKIATYLESKKDCQLWFDLEILLTKYYDYIFRKIIQSNKKDDLFHIHKYEVFPYIQKTLSEFIYTKVQYTYNNLKLDKESNASKLLKDMVSRISTSDSKIITFNYTGTSILKKELENLLPRKLKKNEIFDKITESIFSVHGDVYSNENFNSNIVLGNSDRYINENKTKQLLDKTFQNAIINGKRSDNFFKKFDSFIIFGHSFGECDSYFFIKLFK